MSTEPTGRMKRVRVPRQKAPVATKEQWELVQRIAEDLRQQVSGKKQAVARVVPAVPFAPFHPVALTPEQVAVALRGRQDDLTVRAVMMILEGLDCCAINDMVTNLPMGQGGHSYLQEAMMKIRGLVMQTQ